MYLSERQVLLYLGYISTQYYTNRHALSPRAAIPSATSQPNSSSSSSSIALYALIAVTVLLAIAGFFLVRFVRRHKPSFLPNYDWLRGKGKKGAKGRLGLIGVELLPTSMRSIPTPIPSTHIGAFAGSSNVGKDKDTSSSLLSRSSSLDMLPTTNTQPSPSSTFPIRSPRNPFKFSMLNDNKSKSRSYTHRRSKSLNVPIRHLPVVPSSPSATLSASSPPTPSPQPLLIDFSNSNSSSSSTELSQVSSFSKATTSSDVGTHRFSPDAVVGPLIPIPMPLPSPSIQKSTSPSWAYDFDEDGEQDPLMAAFKRSQSQVQAIPTPDLIPSFNIYPQPQTPSTAGFPLTPPPPGLYFNRLDMNAAAWSNNNNKGKDRDISSPLSPFPTDAIELVSITPPSPSPVGAVTKDLEGAPVFPLPFSAARWNEEPKAKDVKLVDLADEEEPMPQIESGGGMAGIGRKTFVGVDQEPLVDIGRIHEDEKHVIDEEAFVPQTESGGMAGIGRKTFVDVDQEPLVDLGRIHEDEEHVVDEEAVHSGAHLEEVVGFAPVPQEVEHNVDDHVNRETEMPTISSTDDGASEEEEEEEEESLSPTSTHSSTPSSPSPQYSPPLGMLHTSPLPISSGMNLVDISRSPSPLEVGEPFVVPPSPTTRASWSHWDADDANMDEAGDAWGFGTAMDKVEEEEESSMHVRDHGEQDLIRFDGNGSDGGGVREVKVVDVEEDREAWFAEEPTVVWNDVSEDVQIENDVQGGNVLLAPVLHVEKNVQVQEIVFEEEKPVFEDNNVQPATTKEMTVESELLAPPDDTLVHDIPQEDEKEKEKTDVNVSHDVYDIMPITKTIALEPLLIPSTTMHKEEDSEFPDPDLLPLPDQQPSTLPSQKPSVPTTVKTPAQTPTPPASPPISPWRFDVTTTTRSGDYSGLTTPTSTMAASPLTPMVVSSPVIVASAPSPSSATLTASTRPAWSLRAADAPALGLPAPGSPNTVEGGGVRSRSSPDMRTKMKALGDVTEKENEKIVEMAPDELAVKDSSNLEKEDKTTNDRPLPLPLPIKLSTSLPGTFPSPEPTAKPLPLTASPPPAPPPPPPAAAPTVTSDNLPLAAPGPHHHLHHHRTPRSPLDIALAMQLRPGLGLGADPAWMVRFLMSMFGWFAILISGRGDFDTYMYAGSGGLVGGGQ